LRIIAFIFLFINILSANSIKAMLATLIKKEDLSNLTQKESGGIKYIIPSYNLKKMQAKTLADVLKNTFISSTFNRYNNLDPWRLTTLPFSSSGIKVFLDNVEVTSPFYNSGLILFSNLNISFINHIEIYYLPSDFSQSNGYIIIKLFSKEPQREQTNTIKIEADNFKSNSQILELAKNNYYYLSRTLTHYKKIENLNKNLINYTALVKLKRWEFLGIKEKENVPVGLSLDGNSIEHKNFTYLWGNYKIKKENFFFAYSLIYEKRRFIQKEYPILYFDNFYKTAVTSADFKIDSLMNKINIYFNNKYKNHSCLYGISASYIKFLNSIYENNIKQDFNAVSNKTIIRAYLDYKNRYLKNSIFNIGFDIKKVIQNRYPNFFSKDLKIGNTYLLNKSNIFQIYYYLIQTSSPNFLLSTFYGTTPPKLQKNYSLIFKYTKKLPDLNLNLVFFKGRNKNFPIYTHTLQYSKKTLHSDVVNLRVTKEFGKLNNLVLDTYYITYKNIPIKYTFKLSILNFHSFRKFDFFENYIFKIRKLNSYEKGHLVNAGVKYHYSPNFLISLKLQNILGKDSENSYIRVNPLTKTYLEPIKVENTQKSINLSMEYMF